MVAPPFNGLLCGKFVHANVPSEHFVQPKDVRFGAAVGAAVVGIGAAVVGIGAAVVGIVVGTGAAVVGIVVGTGAAVVASVLAELV
jgi:hypothetical protein